MKNLTKNLTSVALAATLIFQMVLRAGFAGIPPVYADTPEKIIICHSTSSHQNPYNTENPNKSGDVSGHDGHNGPIWFSGITVEWGDIIPPFDYTYDSGTGRNKVELIGHYDGKNWTTEGQAIYDNDCEIPSEEEAPILGCTDSNATNYNPLANEDDGTCQYPQNEVLGCTDPVALNYNPLATVNDQSCEYLIPITPTSNQVTPTPTPTCNPGSSLVNGVCAHPQPQNGVNNSNNQGQVASATVTFDQGQVLGTSTMANTGSVETGFFNFIGAIGTYLMGLALKKKTK